MRRESPEPGGELGGAASGETILLGTYGNGCDVVVLGTTELIGSLQGRRGVRAHLAAKAMLPGYEQYLRWRELVPLQPPARPPIEPRMPSPAAQWREVPWELRLTGTKCGRAARRSTRRNGCA